MAKYFNISHGLRGGYMPDSEPYVVMVTSRRALKEALASEADMLGDNMIGLSKRAVASVAQMAWQESKKKHPAYLPFVIPCHDRSVTIAKYSYGIFCAVATRADYVEYTKGSES